MASDAVERGVALPTSNPALRLPDTPPDYDSTAPRSRIREELRSIVAYRDLIWNLVKRNVTARYKRSVLGVLWTLLDPILTMIVMSVVFTALFRRSIPAFPVYLLSGLLAWNFFTQSTRSAMNDLVRGGSLIGRVYLPSSIFAFTAVGTGLVNFLIACGLLIPLILVYRVPIGASLLFLPLGLLIITAFTLGVGLVMSSFVVFFTDMENIYQILIRLLFYASGIIYSVEMLPGKMQTLIAFVPTYHLVSMFRDPLYRSSFPEPFSVAYAATCAAVALIVGLWIFTRNADEYIYRL
jgi:ABC-type polysaccharide/polyol phosphate export permease